MTIENDPSYIERRKFLEDNRPKYIEIVNTLNDAKQVRGLINAIRMAVMPIYRYDPYDSPNSAAIAGIVQVQSAFHTLFADMEFVEQYEETQAEQMAAARASEGLSPQGQTDPSDGELG
jgi:hypothetical protein